MTDTPPPAVSQPLAFSYVDIPVKEINERQRKWKVIGYWVAVCLVPVCLAFELASLGAEWFEWRLNDKVVIKGAILQFTDQNSEGQRELSKLPQQLSYIDYGVPSIPKKSYFDAYMDSNCFDQSKWQQTLDCLMYRNLHLSGVFYVCFGIFICTGCVLWEIALMGLKQHYMSKNFKLVLIFSTKFWPLALTCWQLTSYIIWVSLNLPNSTCDNPSSDWKDWYQGGDCISYGNTCFGAGAVLGLIALLLIAIASMFSYIFGYYEGYGTKELLQEQKDRAIKGSQKHNQQIKQWEDELDKY